MKREPQDVSEYLARMSREECVLAIKDWFKEIEEELLFLTKRKEEVENEIKEFARRIGNNHTTRSYFQSVKKPKNEQFSLTA
jgi:hypothetical protein